MQDPQTGLQLKGARWYSPGLDRFVSVDPIQDGTNWYEAFGNDPVNYADPSGLSPSFHPLNNFNLSLGAPRPAAAASPFQPFNANQFIYDSIAAAPRQARSSAPVINQQAVAQYRGEVDRYSAQRDALQAQLASTRQSLADRRFYEVFGSRSDRAQISALNDQLATVYSHRQVARDNLASAQRGRNAAAAYQGTEYVSVGRAAAGGLKTGGKAVGNAFAGSASLGFYDGPFAVTQQDLDNGYNASRFIAGVSSEFLVGAATGGLATYSKAGTAARYASKAALAYDTAGNVVNVGQGVYDVSQNGLSYGNVLQIAGGAAGVGGNVAAGGRALQELGSDAFGSGFQYTRYSRQSRFGGIRLKANNPAVDEAVEIGALSVQSPRARATVHHIASPTDRVYGPQFQQMFADAGLDVKTSPWNLTRLGSHAGPHGQATNQIVFDRLYRATAGLQAQTAPYRDALLDQLWNLRREVQNTDFGDLFRAPASRADVMGRF